MCVLCVCVRERERESVCESVCVCVRERERQSVCERESVYECVYVMNEMVCVKQL